MLSLLLMPTIMAAVDTNIDCYSHRNDGDGGDGWCESQIIAQTSISSFPTGYVNAECLYGVECSAGYTCIYQVDPASRCYLSTCTDSGWDDSLCYQAGSSCQSWPSPSTEMYPLGWDDHHPDCPTPPFIHCEVFGPDEGRCRALNCETDAHCAGDCVIMDNQNHPFHCSVTGGFDMNDGHPTGPYPYCNVCESGVDSGAPTCWPDFACTGSGPGECGWNGCENCGSCPAGWTCDPLANECLDTSCTPDCSGRVCGPDPLCSESCGTCAGLLACENGACVGCGDGIVDSDGLDNSVGTADDEECDPPGTSTCDASCSLKVETGCSSGNCCANGIDDDGDLLVDEMDPDCVFTLSLAPASAAAFAVEVKASLLAADGSFPAGEKEICDFTGCDVVTGACANTDPYGDGSLPFFCQMTGSETSCTFIDSTLNHSGNYTYVACYGTGDGFNTAAARYELFPFCGDALLHSTEECDDGNLLPGDGCDSLCKLEPPLSAIEGYVRDQFSPLADAVVALLIPGCADCSDITDSEGYYVIGSIPPGTHDVQVVKTGYPSQSREIFFPPDEIVEENWVLGTGSCVGCLSDEGRCSSECSRADACGYDVPVVCNQSLPNTWVPLNESHDIWCCDGTREKLSQTGRPLYSGEMKNLVKFTKIQKYNGVPAQWDFIFWKEV
jgi:cysteine-rich repeat protein